MEGIGLYVNYRAGYGYYIAFRLDRDTALCESYQIAAYLGYNPTDWDQLLMQAGGNWNPYAQDVYFADREVAESAIEWIEPIALMQKLVSASQ